MEENDLLTLTADIVAAHVSHNSVAVNDVPNLVQRVHEALSGLGAPAAEPAEEKKQPAVSIRSSVKPDSITCLICGKKQKTLKRHLQTAHGLDPRQYREEFGLRADYPMTAPDYTETRRTLAKSIGLGRNRKGSGANASAAPSKPARGRRRAPKADTPASE